MNAKVLGRYGVLRLASVFVLLFAIAAAHAEALAANTAQSPSAVIQKFVDAYNAGNIERMVALLAENVQYYTYPGQLNFEGKEKVQAFLVDLFAKSPDVRCEIVKRIELGTTVIDQEQITGLGQGVLEEITIYQIKDGKIARIEAITR